MDYLALNDAIKKGELGNLYLFQGEENFTKERSLRRIMELWKDQLPEINLSVYQDTSREDELVAAINALPMMADRRLVVVKDCPALQSRGGDMPQLLETVKDLPETTMAIFFMRGKADGKRSLTKALKPYAVEFPRLGEKEMLQYLRVDARRRGLAWDGGAAERLIFQVGDDMACVALEAEKLYAAVQEGRITQEDVERYGTRNITANVFQMMDQVLRGRMGEAMVRLEEVLSEGKQPVMLLGGIAYRIRGLMVAKAAELGRMTQGEAIKKLRGSRYFFQNASREAKKYSEAQICQAMMAVTEAEFAIKSGRMRDKAAVVSAIFSGFGVRG